MAWDPYIGLTYMEAAQSQPHLVVNEAIDGLAKAIAGRLALNLTGKSTLTLTGGESTNAILHITATDQAVDLVVQTLPKLWVVINDGSHAVTIKRAGQSGAPVIGSGTSALAYCDGTDVRTV